MLMGLLACVAGGCLSLGGRTTYVQASPETEARIKGLEARIGALEQALATGGIPPVEPNPGQRIISQAPPPRPPYGPEVHVRD